MSEDLTWETVKIQPYKELLEQLKGIRVLTLREKAALEKKLSEQKVDDGPEDKTE